MKIHRIPELSNYKDWLEKAKYELARYKETSNVYDLANVFLTLNALPEWISKSDSAPTALRTIATQKVHIMQGAQNTFNLDEEKLDQIDHQLKLIRLFCNHAKHGVKKEKIQSITMSTPLPAVFPIRFDHIKVGNRNMPALPILESVINYWEKEGVGA